MRRALLAAFVTAGAAVVLRGQEEPPSFPALVELVTVDVVVTDQRGNPVTGLGRDDFTLLEDGRPQAISSFEAVTGRGEMPRPEPVPSNPRVSTNVGAPVDAGGTYVVVFDEPHLTSLQAERGKRALESFLGGALLEDERVRLVAVGRWEREGTRESLLEALRGLAGRRVPDESPEAMSDYEALRIAVFDDGPLMLRVMERITVLTTGKHPQVAQGERIRNTTAQELGLKLDEGYVKLLARSAYQDAVTRNQATLAALASALEAVADVRGRKSVVLVSEGMIKDPQLDGFQRVLDASRRANAALYFIDTRGLEGIPYQNAQHATYLASIDQGIVMASQSLSSAGAESLAADTGGLTVKNRNDLATGLRRIAADARNYYLLGYAPAPGAGDGKFRRLQVKVSRKGVEVRSRNGYYPAAAGGSPVPGAVPPAAPTTTFSGTAAEGEGEARADLVAALRSPQDRPAIPLRMSAYVFGESSPGRLLAVVAAEVDVRAVAFAERDGRSEGSLDVLAMLVPAGGGEATHRGEQVDLSLTPDKRQSMATRGLPLAGRFDLTPGDYRARLVVRDRTSGRIGTVSHAFEVPAPAFRTSTPVLSDALEAATSAEKAPPTMAAHRTFREQATLYFRFEVYGAARDPATGRPRVASGWAIRDANGDERARSEPSWLVSSDAGVPARLGEVSLTFAPGDYELVLDVRDDVAGRTLEVHEPFAVEGAGS